MGYSLKQTSFAGGFISPQLLARSDQAKYSSGLRYMVNCLIRRYGGAENRPGSIYLDTEAYQTCSVPWVNIGVYFPGQTVSYAGTDYVALVGSTGESPVAFPANWAVVPTSAPVRIIRFVFNYQNSYQLIFSVNNIRVCKNGSPVLLTYVSQTQWNNFTAYLIGNIVQSAGVLWIAQAPSTNSVPGAVAGTWKPMVLSPSGGGYILDIPCNYSTQLGPNYYYSLSIPQAAIPILQAVNLNDVMTVTSQYFQPFQLTRYSDQSWTITPYQVGSALNPPVTVTVTPGVGAGATAVRPTNVVAAGGNNGTFNNSWYVVTSYDAHGQSIGTVQVQTNTGGGASGAFPVNITWTAAAGAVGYAIYAGNNGGPYGLVGVTSTTGFTDSGGAVPAWPGIIPPAVATGSTIFTYVVTAVSAADGSESLASVSASGTGGTPSPTTPNVINWSAVAGAASYNVYRIINGIPGIIGTTTLTTINDTNIQPNFAEQPPVQLTNPDGTPLFSSQGNFPAVCAYFQQRLYFANTVNEPIGVWASRVGSYFNMSVSTPILDSDAINFVVAADEAEPIIAMTDLQKLIIHTGSNEYACTGNQFGTVTATAINCIREGSRGANLPKPVVLGNTEIFVQSRGAFLRDLRFEIGSYTYDGKDLTTFSPSLFTNLSITDMAWQQIGDSIIWVATSNGQLYGITYVANENVWAWHPHTFVNGFVENVCVVPNGIADVVYLIVRRVINGQTVRYLEMLSSRDYQDSVFYSDFIGTDCSFLYNGTVTDGSTVTATTAGTWQPTDLSTLTSSTARFAASDVTNKNQVILSQINPITGLVTDRVTFNILVYISPTQVQGYPQRVVPAWAQVAIAVTPTTSWGKAVTQFAGMTPLAGQSIGVLADGNVAASPLNTYAGPQSNQPAYPTITVSNAGTFALPEAALVVNAGLPIQMDVQTMPLENEQGETILNKHQIIKECCPIFYSSRDGLYGQDQYHLKPWKSPRQGANLPPTSTYGYPIAPYTGPARINIQGTSQITGQVWVRVVDPLPFAMSGIIVSTVPGDQ